MESNLYFEQQHQDQQQGQRRARNLGAWWLGERAIEWRVAFDPGLGRIASFSMIEVLFIFLRR
jgi:hypothetical protein